MLEEENLDHSLVEREAHRKDVRNRMLRSAFVFLFGAGFAVVFGFLTTPLVLWLVGLTGGNNVPSIVPGLKTSIVAGCLLGFLLGSFLGHQFLNLLQRLADKWRKMETGDRVSLYFGIFTGLVASLLPVSLLQALFKNRDQYVFLTILVIAVTVSILCVYALQSMDEVLPWYKPQVRGRKRGTKILDTNVIIDGRISEVAKTGFLEGNLYVPGFVLDELQYIADSHDPLRRQRGRRGLDVLKQLQSEFQLEVRSEDRFAPDLGDGVDARLVRLAKAMGADIVTNDFNLNRVAVLQDVKVLNINDLALCMRPNVLPSETLRVAIIREGSQTHQGVGYLEDGTMVVVENGRVRIGETLDVTVSQVIQTERGKMIFAELPGEGEANGGQNGFGGPAPTKRSSTPRRV